MLNQRRIFMRRSYPQFSRYGSAAAIEAVNTAQSATHFYKVVDMETG
jgi:hypothetical protein